MKYPKNIIVRCGGNRNIINIYNETKKEPSLWDKLYNLIVKIKKLLS